MRNYLLPLFVVLFLQLFSGIKTQGQAIPVPSNDYGIYSFLDELASEGNIELNAAVKPYTRQQIAEHLLQALTLKEKLDIRQQKELLFFSRSYSVEINEAARKTGIILPEDILKMPQDSRLTLLFNPASAVWHDSLFTISVHPILGATMGYNSEGNCMTWRNGGEIYGSVGRWGFFAALRDNHQDPLLGRPVYLTQQSGGHFKGGTDWSEMTGGLSYSWKWGYLGFMKDSPVWGTNYAGANIFSGRAPSFMQLRLYIKPVKWLEMTWIHGWLNSMVVDSTRSYWVSNAYGSDYREVYHQKYIAASMFTLTPFKGLNISAGNSIIWSDPRLTPYYLMPLFFYKSVDHGINSGIDNSNAQMFLDISSRQIKHLHIYGTLFIDEMSVKRFANKDYNFFSWKGGVRAGNFSPVPNLWITTECTFTYPLTFQHYVPVLTFENQGYNLGHYLRDNTREWYFAIDYKPVRAMNIKLFHNRAERGEDFQSVGGSRTGLPYINPVIWKSIRTGIEVSWQITGGVYLTGSFIASDVTGEDIWTPEWSFGEKNTFNAGLTWGF